MLGLICIVSLASVGAFQSAGKTGKIISPSWARISGSRDGAVAQKEYNHALGLHAMKSKFRLQMSMTTEKTPVATSATDFSQFVVGMKSEIYIGLCNCN